MYPPSTAFLNPPREWPASILTWFSVCKAAAIDRSKRMLLTRQLMTVRLK